MSINYTYSEFTRQFGIERPNELFNAILRNQDVDPYLNQANKYINGMTPLMAALVMQIDIKPLIDAGANVNAQYKNANSNVLMFAIYYSTISVIKLLIDSGADINAVNYRGETVAMFIADKTPLYADNIQLLNILLDAGAMIDLQDKYGFTALIHAVHWFDKESINIVKTLINAGANVNIQDKLGSTVLMHAHEQYFYQEFQLFLNTGVNLELQDETDLNIIMHKITNPKILDRFYEFDFRADILDLLIRLDAPQEYFYKKAYEYCLRPQNHCIHDCSPIIY